MYLPLNPRESGSLGPTTVGTVLILLFSLQPVSAAPGIDRTYRANRGKIVFQAEPFEKFTDDEAYAKTVASARRHRTLVRAKDGKWHFNFLAFLKRAPGAKQVVLVWYPSRGKKRTSPVDFVEFAMDPAGKLLSASTVLDPDDGFEAGKDYSVRVTRLVRGRETVYADARVRLR